MLYRLKIRTIEQYTQKYYIPTVEIKDYHVMIDGQNVFNQPVKNNLITYENIRKIAIGQGDIKLLVVYMITLLFVWYFNTFYEIIAIDLSKQQALDADPEAIQQVNFTGNLEQQSAMFFII